MQISYEHLADIRKKHADKTIVFCSGSFDLFHAGHVVFLEEAKSMGDILVVGVGEDKILRDLKGSNRPVLNQHMRLKMADSVKPVDYAFLHQTPPSTAEYSNSFLPDIFSLLRPNKWLINKDASEIPYREKIAKEFGIDFLVSDRTAPPEFEEVSTTKLIKKIIDGSKI